MNNYIENYPRPQLIRDKWESLDGRWDFAFDNDCVGESCCYFNGFKSQHEITVPFTYETQLSGINDSSPCDCVWYSRRINILSGDDSVLINFEGSDYITRLWVNGQYAGEHTGGYNRFTFDITNLVKPGENLIVVCVLDSLNKAQPRGKQRWLDKSFECWYVQTTGIWKSVWLEYAPKTRIDSIKMTPNMADSTIEIIATLNREVILADLTAEIDFESQFISRTSISFEGKTGKIIAQVSCNAIPWAVKNWTPEDPKLYDIKLSLVIDGSASDEILSYFGMRDIKISGRDVLLNGKPLYQRLVLDQGYWKSSHLTPPNEAALVEDIDKIKALGFNGVRKHMKIEDERFLYWADVKGLLVWSEFPATYAFNDEAIESFTEQWITAVKQNYNHPSIITWTPFNESWGVSEIRHDVSQQAFTQGIYYLTKAIDPMRPVICNDGWEHTISDIITLHDYEETGKAFSKRYADKNEILENAIAHNGFKFAFAEGFNYDGQPMIISEYGGIAFSNNQVGWGYGNKVVDEKAFIERYDDITSAIKALDYCCGFCYTQVSDVQQEINGLMNEDRSFKLSPEAIREINLR